MNIHAPIPAGPSYADIAKGISAKQVARWVKAGELSWVDVYGIVPERTFKRRLGEGKFLRPDEADAIARAVRVNAMAVWALQSKARAEVFLDSVNHALGSNVPRVMARTDAGAREVEALLIRLVHGVIG